ncbi:SusC/RagA family TonB-linked outer membrane protein [Carboxylicivirga marina]|uniref:SusC/RagA family TonB-linked outer membrane protein n=1 Tax=Carboxylicivirga marina TaxID=2800988 RepID=A0ABS1HFE1_9BACT|nr:SusC/RagA family TonB-linked outer membrane protein [Carboxylicivirga marina]MBK3516195.1 SusC/RagA family TonB-linked outer membrane protein [Carboxylicivirga marina]
MRLTMVMLIVTLMNLSASTYSQNKNVSLKLKNATIEEALKQIQTDLGIDIYFQTEMIPQGSTVDFETQSATVAEIMDAVLKDTGLTYRMIDDNMVIVPRQSTVNTSAQQGLTVSGTVTDVNGEPLPGVTVSIEGTTTGTITGIDGTYSLQNVEEGSVLLYSFIGFETQTISVAGRTSIDVTLVEEVTDLNEVVVVGYGTQKKANLTGSVSAVKGEELSKRTVTDTRLALQGAATGVTVIDRGGVPGSEDVSIKIRGNTSLSAGSDPLVLVDGIEMPIKEVNPTDIESVSVLKDAASSSIYGSRAANGVILITTKRGKEGDFKVTYDGHMGWQTPATLPESVSAADYLMLVNEAKVNAGRAPKYSQDYIDKTVSGTDPVNYPYTNLFEELYETAPMQNHALRVSGGTEKARVALSMNLLDQDGMLKNINTKRYGLRLNTDFIVNDRLNMRADISFNRRDNEKPTRVNSAISNIVGTSPVFLSKYPNGLYGLNKDNQSPLAALEVGGETEEQRELLNIKAGFDYQVMTGLKWTTDVSYKTLNNRSHRFQAEYEFMDPINEDNEEPLYTWNPSQLTDSRWQEQESNFRSLLNYNKTIGSHGFKALAGFEAIEHLEYFLSGSRNNIYSPANAELNTGDAETKDNSGYRADWALVSYFGRLNYDYNQKYLLEANFRYDGSSRFAEGNKWGFFPSFSAGWRVSEEDFLAGTDFLDNLKLRASWGELGNQDIGYYKFTSPVSTGYYDRWNNFRPFHYNFGNNEATGYSQWYYANEDITWETTQILDIGFDLTMWQGKLGVVADWFQKDTHDVLMTLPISTMVGLAPSESNVGNIRNTGWEVSITHQNRIGEFEYGVGFNLSDIKNEVISLAGQEAVISGWNILQEGEAVWALYGYKSDGLFQSQQEIDDAPQQPNHADLKPGDIKLVDINGDEVINDEDRTIIGSDIPRYTYSIDLNMRYKGFDLNAMFQGVAQAENYFYGAPNEGPNFEIFTTTRALDRWTPDNPNASFPRLEDASNKNNYLYNDFWIRNASYFRMKNLQIGYSFNQNVLEKLQIERLRLYVGGTNLFTVTDVESGLDPETYDGRPSYYPPVSTYLVGMQVTF